MRVDVITADFRYDAEIFLAALRKVTKNLGHGSQLLGRDSDRAGAKYQSEMLPSEPVRFMRLVVLRLQLCQL
jgi:hypothetical protein